MASKPKRMLADMIRADVGAASLAAMEAVSDSDTGREKIVYVPRTSLLPDNRNFYSLDGIEELAANIELVGLLDPLRVRGMEGEDGLYRIVSGHRRRAALDKLALEGNTSYEKVPVIIERGDISPAMQELRLIFANSGTRRMSSADTSKQAERVEALLYELKGEGVEFPGRMRAYVAEACGVVESKLAVLKKIRENLIDDWKARWEADTLSESAAYTLAQMPEKWQNIIFEFFGGSGPSWELSEKSLRARSETFQAIDAIKCDEAMGDGECTNRDNLRRSSMGQTYFRTYCRRCCASCPDLSFCLFACPKLDEKVAQLRTKGNTEKDAAGEQFKQDEAEQAAEDAERVEFLEKLWQRARELRTAKGMDIETFYTVLRSPIYSDDEPNGYDSGAKKINADSDTPFGLFLELDDVSFLIGTADKLGVSLDYLLGRTDDPAPPGANVSDSDTAAPQWRTGTPPREGQYWVLGEDFEGGANIYWRKGQWYFWETGGDRPGGAILKWYPLPEG